MLYLTGYAGLLLVRAMDVRALYYPVLLLLFLFSAFRFEVGCDWTGYLNQFNHYTLLTFSEVLKEPEPIWVGLFVLQDRLGLSYPWINVFSSLIFFAGAHFLAGRQPDPLAFIILLFPILIVNMPMSGIRQAAAIGVMCFAFAAFVDRRMLHFVGLTLLATALHRSAMAFMLLAPLTYGAYSFKRLVFAGLLAVPGALALMSTEAVEVATTRYIDTNIDAAGGAFRAGLLGLTGMFFLLILRRNWAAIFPKDYKLAIIGSLMMLIPIALVPISSVLGDRIGYYLVPIQTMIFARIPYLQLRSNRQLLSAAPYLGLLLVFGVWTFMSSLFQQCYVPYQTWLFGFPEGRYDYY